MSIDVAFSRKIGLRSRKTRRSASTKNNQPADVGNFLAGRAEHDSASALSHAFVSLFVYSLPGVILSRRFLDIARTCDRSNMEFVFTN